MNKYQLKVMSLASIGGILEFYDFAVYGTFAIYFGNQFFPAANKLTNILEVFLVWFLGFALRPVGGILFSHIGDEYGRKMVLIITIFMMGISFLCVAVLPTFATIGYYAPFSLLILRLMQGLAIGGEIPTTYVYLRESFQKNVVLMFSFFMASLFIGYLLSSVTNFILVQSLTNEQLIKFGWRIPFLIGSIICFIAYYIRKTLQETDDFKNILNRARIPLLLLFRSYKKPMFIALFVAASQQVFSVTIVAFLQTLLKLFTNLSIHQTSDTLLFGILFTTIFILIFGYIYKNNQDFSKLYKNFLRFNIIAVPLAFYLMFKTNYLYLGLIILMMAHALVCIAVPLYITTLFPIKIRLTGFAVSYNFSVAIFASPAPIIITKLIQDTPLSIYAAPFYITLFVVIAYIIILMKKNDNKEDSIN